MRTYPHRAVAKAVAAGVLPAISKKTKCVDCGKSAKYYDHRDYSNPLAVVPVCCSCNTKRGKAKNSHLFKRQPSPNIRVYGLLLRQLKEAAKQDGRTLNAMALRMIEKGLTA